MKLNEVYDEMLELAKKIGVTVRKESGKFRGGNCKLNEEEVIVINNAIPLEQKSSMLAKSLSNYNTIHDVFMKPAVRDYIENEQYKREKETEIQLIINTSNN